MKMQRTRGGHYPGSPSTAPHRTVPSPIKSSSSTPSITRSSKCSVGPGAALARALGESFQHSHSLQKHDATRTSGDGPRAVAGGGGPPGGVAGRTRMGHVNEHEGAKATSRVTLALPWMHPLRIGDAHTEASPRPQHNAFFRSTPPAFNISPLPSRCKCLIWSGYACMFNFYLYYNCSVDLIGMDLGFHTEQHTIF